MPHPEPRDDYGPSLIRDAFRSINYDPARLDELSPPRPMRRQTLFGYPFESERLPTLGPADVLDAVREMTPGQRAELAALLRSPSRVLWLPDGRGGYFEPEIRLGLGMS